MKADLETIKKAMRVAIMEDDQPYLDDDGDISMTLLGMDIGDELELDDTYFAELGSDLWKAANEVVQEYNNNNTDEWETDK